MGGEDWKVASGQIKTQELYSHASVFLVLRLKEDLRLCIFLIVICGWPQSMKASVCQINGGQQQVIGIYLAGLVWVYVYVYVYVCVYVLQDLNISQQSSPPHQHSFDWLEIKDDEKLPFSPITHQKMHP